MQIHVCRLKLLVVQEHSVVALADVRVWLSAYAAAPKAQHAAALRDGPLAALLLGGGSLLQIQCAPCIAPAPGSVSVALLTVAWRTCQHACISSETAATLLSAQK